MSRDDLLKIYLSAFEAVMDKWDHVPRYNDSAETTERFAKEIVRDTLFLTGWLERGFDGLVAARAAGQPVTVDKPWLKKSTPNPQP